MRKLFHILLICFALVSLLIFGLISCNRNKGEGTTTVEGVLVDEIDGTPLANCEVFLEETVSLVGRLDNGNRSMLKSTTTDANGNFSFEFEAEIVYLYHVTYHSGPDKYFGGSHIVNAGKKNNIKLKAERAGILKLDLINEPPAETADTMMIFAFPPYNPGPNDNESLFSLYERNISLKDTTILIKCPKNIENTLNWKIKSKSNLQEGEYKFTVNAWDTIYYSIRY